MRWMMEMPEKKNKSTGWVFRCERKLCEGLSSVVSENQGKNNETLSLF